MSEIRSGWICFVIFLTAAACLDEADPPARRDRDVGARALVRSWQSAAIGLEEKGAAPLLTTAGTPFVFVGGPEVAGFRAEDTETLRRELSVRERQALVRTAALVVEAERREPEWESTRPAEIRAKLGGDRGYALTMRRSADGWKVVRFEVSITPRP